MQQLRKTLGLLSLILIALGSISTQAQQPRFLSLTPPEGLPVVPVMEGWIANPDGSRSFSFGYINRNEEAIDLPLGEANYMDPPEYSGMQPTHFLPGHDFGVFTVTVPADKATIDVWWYLKTGTHDALKVPGRAGIGAYELDFVLPRPQGALQPFAGFGENNDIAPGLFASVRDYPGTVMAGTSVLLTVKVKDPSVRDANDPRFNEALPVGVKFTKLQGEGAVTFTRHPDTEVPVNPFKEGDPRFSRFREPDANQVSVPGGEGLARVYATFAAPGNYVIRAKVDNFRAPDSADGDQCCWTNVYQRVTVTP